MKTLTGFTLFIASLTLTACLKNIRLPSVSCSSLSSNTTRYYNSNTDCRTSSTLASCDPIDLIIGGKVQTCYSDSNGSSAPKLSLNPRRVEAGFLNWSTSHNFVVSNAGSLPASQCLARIIGNPYFTLDSSYVFDLPSGGTRTIPVRANYYPNGGSRSGELRVECSNTSPPPLALIQATFGSGSGVITVSGPNSFVWSPEVTNKDLTYQVSGGQLPYEFKIQSGSGSIINDETKFIYTISTNGPTSETVIFKVTDALGRSTYVTLNLARSTASAPLQILGYDMISFQQGTSYPSVNPYLISGGTGAYQVKLVKPCSSGACPSGGSVTLREPGLYEVTPLESGPEQETLQLQVYDGQNTLSKNLEIRRLSSASCSTYVQIKRREGSNISFLKTGDSVTLDNSSTSLNLELYGGIPTGSASNDPNLPFGVELTNTISGSPVFSTLIRGTLTSLRENIQIVSASGKNEALRLKISRGSLCAPIIFSVVVSRGSSAVSSCSATGFPGAPSLTLPTVTKHVKLFGDDITVPLNDEFHINYSFKTTKSFTVSDPDPTKIVQQPGGTQPPLAGGYISRSDLQLANPGSIIVPFYATFSDGTACSFQKTFTTHDPSKCSALKIKEVSNSEGLKTSLDGMNETQFQLRTEPDWRLGGRMLNYSLILPWDETVTQLIPKPDFLQGTATVTPLKDTRVTTSSASGWMNTIIQKPILESLSSTEPLTEQSISLSDISVTPDLPDGYETLFRTPSGTLKPVFQKLVDFIKKQYEITTTSQEYLEDTIPATLVFQAASKTIGLANQDMGGQGISLYRSDGQLNTFFCNQLNAAEREQFYIDPGTPISSGTFDPEKNILTVRAKISWKSASCAAPKERFVEILYHIKIPSVKWTPTGARTGSKFPCP